MRSLQIITQMPYPIASVYADLDHENVSLQTRREALYFTLILASLHAYTPARLHEINMQLSTQ